MNTTATVVNIDLLKRQAALATKAAIAYSASHGTAITAVIEYGKALIEGRRLHGENDKEFGKWVVAESLDRIKPFDEQQERTAAMKIAGISTQGTVPWVECPRNRPTHIMSWWRDQQRDKNVKVAKKENGTRRGKGDMEKSEAAFALIMDEVDATGNYPNSKADDADAKYGASHTILEGVIFAVRKVREFKAEQKQVVAEAVAEVKAEVSDEALIASAKPLNKNQQAHIDAIVRRETKRLEKEHATRMAALEKEYIARRAELEKLAKAREDSFTARLSAEAEARYKKRFPHLEEREIEAARMQELYQERLRTKAFFSRDQAKTILMCLHPDGSESRSKEKLHAAFLLFNAKLTILTGETKEG